MSLLLPGISLSQDTLICDNGGFEDDFDYYFGFYSYFVYGSNTCTPQINGNPVVFTSISMPAFRRFEIVSGGTDPLIGIPRTKFGSKSVLLNNRYGHFNPACDGHWDANRITKRFKVTEENREFTVWYAAILENPSGHINSQPYFSIKCNRAPQYDLCIDADLIECEDTFSDTNCTFTVIDDLDWACHRIKIPKNMIDSIATIEITASDCGCGKHFGYAYIDGICEECDGSALGTAFLFDQPFSDLGYGIKYRSCEADTIRICGTFELPILCGEWEVDSIKVPGYTITNVTVDEISGTFCFDFPNSNFPSEDCIEIYTTIYFSTSTSSLPTQLSNSIEICPTDYIGYNFILNTSTCYDNYTDEFISDDYYYVAINIEANYGDDWYITRQLDNPSGTESGLYTIESGTGSGTIVLGPFLIQEGSWDLFIYIGNCEYEYQIIPPDFCGLCTYFNKLKITDILCDNNNPSTGSDDTWTFELNVPRLLYTGVYELYKGVNFVDYYSYNNDHQIEGGLITGGCIDFELKDYIVPGCKVQFKVCPPKSCSSDNSECTLEAYIKKYYCEDGEFSFDIEIKNANPANLCYRAQGATIFQQGTLPSGSLGPFDEDVTVTIYFCNTPTCFKRIYVPYLDCDEDNFQGGGSARSFYRSKIQDLFIAPNPINNDEINISSMLDFTNFEIFNIHHQTIYKGNFKGSFLKVNLELNSGVYILQYINKDGIKDAIKFVKP